MSATATTVFVTELLLLAVLGSAVLLVTWAVSVMLLPFAVLEFTWSTSWNVSLFPAGSAPPLAGPPVWTKETSVVLAGSVSDVITFCASLGPLLVVVIE